MLAAAPAGPLELRVQQFLEDVAVKVPRDLTFRRVTGWLGQPI